MCQFLEQIQEHLCKKENIVCMQAEVFFYYNVSISMFNLGDMLQSQFWMCSISKVLE